MPCVRIYRADPTEYIGPITCQGGKLTLIVGAKALKRQALGGRLTPVSPAVTGPLPQL